MNIKLIAPYIIFVCLIGILSSCTTSTKEANIPMNTSIVSSPKIPEATAYVIDMSGVLKEETKLKLEETLKQYDQTAQIAVVTIPSTQPLDEKEYAIKLAEKWKPGYKGKDNGIIFLVVTGDRKVRIEVGRGLEGTLTDSQAGKILDEAVVPFLKNNDWEGGINSGVQALINKLSN